MIGDEALAYTGTQFDEDEEPRFVLITQRDLEWIPERWQERIRTQLRASPEGVLVRNGSQLCTRAYPLACAIVNPPSAEKRLVVW